MDSPMTKTQVEVITSVQRRRSWSRSEKERIVAAAMEPGAVASEVARAAGIHVSQLFRWRQRCLRGYLDVAGLHSPFNTHNSLRGSRSQRYLSASDSPS